MKRTLTTLAVSAALLAGGASAAQAATSCQSIPVPAVDAVYETVTVPAVTVTEWEFIHAQDGNGNSQGQGPEVKWTEDANWNSQGNAHSIGWTATGASRVRVIEVERSVVKLVSPAVPASSYEQCVTVPDGLPDQRPVEEIPVPEAPAAPAPVAAQPVAPAPVAQPVAIQAPAAPVAAPVAVIPAQPVAAVQAAPEELAYTGAADWVLPAGLALVLMGAAAVASRRFITIK